MTQAEASRSTSGMSSRPRPSARFRWVVWLLLVAATTINFADRAVFGLTAEGLQEHLGLTDGQYGLAASAFNWGYTLTMFVAGVLIIRIGPRKTILFALSGWAIMVMLTPFAPTLLALIVVRVLFGVGEAANFPSSGAFIGQWFPARERNSATASISVGEGLGSAAIVPAAATVQVAFGWQAPYIMLGFCALVWLLFAIILLRNKPADSKFVTTAEREYIESDLEGSSASPFRATWRAILTNPTVWGAALSSWAAAYMVYFALSFLPLYLQDAHHVPEAALASFASVPWIMFVIGGVLGARVSDMLFRRYQSLRIARGVLGGVVLIVIAVGTFVLPMQATSLTGAEVLLALIMFFVGWANGNLLTLAVDSCPRDASRTTGLVFGVASSSGIVAPLVTGQFVEATGSYNTAFGFAGVVCLVCALIAFFAVRDGKVISPETDTASATSTGTER